MEDNKVVANCFVAGAKSLGRYGGYESFLKKLVEHHKDDKDIKYYIACKSNGDGKMVPSELEGASEVKFGVFTYCNAKCFLIKVPEWMGVAQAIYYDIAALKLFCKIIEEIHIENPIVYILACRIGPFVKKYVKKIHALGGKVYVNPDGHEWKRAKWCAPVRKYWKESERLMVKNSDLLICDSVNIEKYIKDEYKRYNPDTTYIAYGAETSLSSLADDDPKYVEWLNKHEISTPFFTVIGRCVPENNYETIIREFMRSHTNKNLVIITTNNPSMLNELNMKLHYKDDRRIKFVGTVYNSDLLMKIREKSFAYIHGHSVGGTNPSLLEALGSTKLNLLYSVDFNKEVAGDAALYWTLEDDNLAKLIDESDKLLEAEIETMAKKAKQRISDAYSWGFIADEYKRVFY
jgi:rhamnosyltransferase